MLIRQNVCGGLSFFVGSQLAEHLKLKKSDAKSRYIAGLLDVIYYF
jgi:hypothetical protein